jgi:propionyl-CoA synthetase
MPPGCLPTSEQRRGLRVVLPDGHGHYLTGDAGYEDEDGYLYIMSRVDDIINVAGHRLSTGAMEEVLAGHPDVAECAVVGVADTLKGEIPVGFVVTKAGVNRSDAELAKQLVERVREHIGPVAAFKLAMVRSAQDPLGQDPESTMKKIAQLGSSTACAPSTTPPPSTLRSPPRSRSRHPRKGLATDRLGDRARFGAQRPARGDPKGTQALRVETLAHQRSRAGGPPPPG